MTRWMISIFSIGFLQYMRGGLKWTLLASMMNEELSYLWETKMQRKQKDDACWYEQIGICLIMRWRAPGSNTVANSHQFIFVPHAAVQLNRGHLDISGFHARTIRWLLQCIRGGSKASVMVNHGLTVQLTCLLLWLYIVHQPSTDYFGGRDLWYCGR